MAESDGLRVRLAHAFLLLATAGVGCEPSPVLPDASGIDARASDDVGLEAPRDAVVDRDSADGALVDVGLDTGGTYDGGLDGGFDAGPPSPCGNGERDVGEVCDDGNRIGGDGCRADCLGTEACGDGLVDVGEYCIPHDATSTPVTGAIAWASAPVDVDGDGDLDLLLHVDPLMTGSRVVQTFRNDGSAVFEVFTSSLPSQPIALGSLDGDASADALLLDGSGLVWWRSMSDGSFEGPNPISATRPIIAVIGDVTGDGAGDIVVLEDSTVTVFPNRGAGTFATPVTIALHASAEALTLASLDADPALDIAVAHSSGGSSVSVIRSLGGGVFEAPVTYRGDVARGVAGGDLDGDGDIDLVVASAARSSGFFFLNDGSGAFGAAREIRAPGSPFPPRVGDLDFDGDADVVLYGPPSPLLSVLRNDGLGSDLPEARRNDRGSRGRVRTETSAPAVG